MKGETQPPLPNATDAVPAELELRPWIDQHVETHGFAPRSMYVEMCWLPILGPTATWLYRRLGSWVEFNADGLTIDLADVAQSLGLGAGTGEQSPVRRSIERLVRFDAARWTSDHLQVRRALAPLARRHVERLTDTNRHLHEEYVRQLGHQAINGTDDRRIIK